MKVLVTGANGQLGHDVVEVFGAVHETVGYGRTQLDVSEQEATMSVIQEFRPNLIVHCAAYTAVDKAESDYETAYAVNALGCRNVALAAAKVDAKLISISTDYVFDGLATAPYPEGAQTNPQSVYGKTKLAGEEFVQKLVDKHFVVRTSWVFGVHGNNFVKTMLRMGREGKSLRVVNDQLGSPTYTRDLAHFLLSLAESDAYGVYHATNDGVCSWYAFARAIFAEAELEVDVQACTTSDFPRPAPRPAYSALGHRALVRAGLPTLRPWCEALRDFLRELNDTEQSGSERR